MHWLSSLSLKFSPRDLDGKKKYLEDIEHCITRKWTVLFVKVLLEILIFLNQTITWKTILFWIMFQLKINAYFLINFIRFPSNYLKTTKKIKPKPKKTSWHQQSVWLKAALRSLVALGTRCLFANFFKKTNSRCSLI